MLHVLPERKHYRTYKQARTPDFTPTLALALPLSLSLSLSLSLTLTLGLRAVGAAQERQAAEQGLRQELRQGLQGQARGVRVLNRCGVYCCDHVGGDFLEILYQVGARRDFTVQAGRE